MNEERFDRILGFVSDGEPVNWEETGRDAGSAEERRWIRNLRVISEVRRLARTVESHPGAPDRPAASPSGAPGPATPAAREERNGLPLDRWGDLTLLEPLGRGGFGDVYRAWDGRLRREVALKLYRGPAKNGGTRALLEEARLLARVEHPHVVRVYGAEAREGRAGLWMELVRGVDLATLLEERGPLEPGEAVRIGIDLCQALAAVHAAGIIHQDVKPRNVMRSADGRLLLMDFGAGLRRGPEADDAEAASGTPACMAPELFQGARPTPRSDVYSLGVLLFNALSGVYPVPGRNAAEIAEAHRGGRRRPLKELAPETPEWLASVIERALSTDPRSRFASAEEFRLALESKPGAAGEGRPAGIRRAPRSWFAGALALGALVAIGLLTTKRPPPEAPVVEARFRAVRDGVARLLQPGDEVTSSDAIELDLKVDREAHVYVLNLDEAGAAAVLFPVPETGLANPLAAAETRRLPGDVEGRRHGWTLNDVRGVETFLVVASGERLGAFEAELERFSVIGVDEGVPVRPLDAAALGVLTRGVTGMRRIPESRGSPPVLELARALIEGEGRRGIWMESFAFRNPGS